MRSASSTTSMAWHQVSWRTLCTVEPPPGKRPRRGPASWNHAGQDGDVGVVVVAKADPGVGELAEVLEVERVPLLGAVDGDGDDVSVLLVVDRHGVAFTPPGAGGARVAPARVGC